jgi:hypothetical protein
MGVGWDGLGGLSHERAGSNEKGAKQVVRRASLCYIWALCRAFGIG